MVLGFASLPFSRLVANTPGAASRTVAEEGMRPFLDSAKVIPFRRRVSHGDR
jgi:hypothetical protein